MKKLTSLSFILTVFMAVTAMTSFQFGYKTNKYDWTSIKEFKFYGFVNPKDSITSKYVIADIDKIKKIFSGSKKSNGFLPKGASRFATITFENKKTITIQIIPGGHSPFRVIKKDILKDDWYDFDDNSATEWTNYLGNLADKLK